MADKKKDPLQNTETPETRTSLSDQIPGVGGAMDFMKKNQNIFLAAGAVIIGLVIFFMLRGSGGSSGAKEFAADKSLQPIGQYMSMDSLDLVMNGNDSLGVTAIKKFISKNKGTKAADEALLYGAICYMNAGNSAEAIKMLKDVGSFGKQIQARKFSLLGDAYSEKGTAANPLNQSDCKEAIDYYRKAADQFTEDGTNASMYLFKAAQLSAQIGNNAKAKEFYQEIKDKYPTSKQINLVEKYLGKEGVEN